MVVILALGSGHKQICVKEEKNAVLVCLFSSAFYYPRTTSYFYYEKHTPDGDKNIPRFLRCLIFWRWNTIFFMTDRFNIIKYIIFCKLILKFWSSCLATSSYSATVATVTIRVYALEQNRGLQCLKWWAVNKTVVLMLFFFQAFLHCNKCIHWSSLWQQQNTFNSLFISQALTFPCGFLGVKIESDSHDDLEAPLSSTGRIQ